VRGIAAGIADVMRMPEGTRTISIDGDGQFQSHAGAGLRKHLRETKAKRVLVGAANDPSALGALRAFQEGRPRKRVRRGRAKKKTREKKAKGGPPRAGAFFFFFGPQTAPAPPPPPKKKKKKTPPPRPLNQGIGALLPLENILAN